MDVADSSTRAVANEAPRAVGPLSAEDHDSAAVDAAPGPHVFHAFAFVENLSLKELGTALPGAKKAPHELRLAIEPAGEIFAYPFGVIVFFDVPAERRDAEVSRLRSRYRQLAAPVVEERFTVRVEPASKPGISESILVIDRLTEERAGVIAHTVAQSAAMEYYEQIVDGMFAETGAMVDRLEESGTVSPRTRPLHRFIGRAIGIRSEVLAVLHLLDKPDATWEDPAMDRLYEDLRTEFDLADRFGALETKLRGVQEALELVLDVARDRRLVLLDASVVLLIVIEVLLALFR